MADTLAELTLERLRRLRELQEQKRAIETGDARKKPWRQIARPEQLEPPGDWFIWLLLGGRGVGKTRSAAEFILEKARRFPGARVALVGKTIGDARDTMVEGDSGILNCVAASELRGGSIDTAWNRSLGEIYFRNGTYAKTFSSEKPWRLRGPQFNFGWADESCFWADAHKGTNADTTWSNLTIATRLPASPGWPDDYRIQIVVATTPRPVALLRVTDLKLMAPGLMQRENVVITRGRTVDNLANLSETYRVNVIAPLIGTALGRQELDAEILEARDGALWKRELIDQDRYSSMPRPEMVRVVIGVDPATTSAETSDLTGIIVAGADRNGQGYVIADHTMRGTPMEVMKKVAWCFEEYEADRVVAEVNNGGDYIGTTLHAVDPNIPYRKVTATRGKATRAEPVSALYEQHRVHHLGSFPELEDEMCHPAGTLIFARRGQVPVEHVTQGDEVMTRDGWAPVAWAGKTGTTDTLIAVTHEHGTVLSTPCHPIYRSDLDRFVSAQSVRPGNSLIVVPSLAFTAGRSHGADAGTTEWNQGTSVTPEASYSIASSGKRTTDPFQSGPTSTTSTTTPVITAWKISPWSHLKNTAKSTARTAVPPTGRAPSWTAPKRRTANGGVTTKVVTTPARNAVPHSPQETCERNAAQLRSVNARVRTVGNVNVANGTPVYNLTVANGYAPEYFANGVLVHNCTWAPMDPDSPDRLDAMVWAFYDLKSLIAGSWQDAYGIVTCTACQRPFLGTANGVPREKCPHCNAPREAA